MLDYIRGRVISKSPTRLILEVAGIGYLLHIPLSTFEKIHKHGEVTILTQLFIREDQIKIFGFATGEERDLFQLLLSVNGIGPETADSIILYAAKKPIFVIDAYTRRFCKKYFNFESKNYDEYRTFFEDNLSQDLELFKEYHALIVEWAKNTKS